MSILVYLVFGCLLCVSVLVDCLFASFDFFSLVWFDLLWFWLICVVMFRFAVGGFELVIVGFFVVVW